MNTVSVTLTTDDWATVRIALLLHAGEADDAGRDPAWVAMVSDTYGKLAAVTMGKQARANGPLVRESQVPATRPATSRHYLVTSMFDDHLRHFEPYSCCDAQGQGAHSWYGSCLDYPSFLRAQGASFRVGVH